MLDSNNKFTIDNVANYIIDSDVRSLFLTTIGSIRKIGYDIQENVESKGITYWVAGLRFGKFGELVQKKKSFWSGLKVSPEANTIKPKWPVVKNSDWKWYYTPDITTKEKADELVTEFMTAYQLIKKIGSK